MIPKIKSRARKAGDRPPRGNSESNPFKIAYKTISKMSGTDAETIAQALGVNGYAKSLTACDVAGAAHGVQLMASILEECAASFGPRRVSKVELLTDNGITPIDAPVIRTRAVKKGAVDLVQSSASHKKTSPGESAADKQRRDGWAVVTTNHRVLRGCPSLNGGTVILTTARMIMWTDPDEPPDDLRARLRAKAPSKNSLGVRALRICSVERAIDWAKLAEWLVGVSDAPTKLVETEGITKIVRVAKGYTAAEAIRLTQCLACHRPMDLVTSVGKAVAVTQRYGSKLNSWQNGRIASQPPLPVNFDPWVTFARLAPSLPEECSVPVRTDLAVPALRNPKAKRKLIGGIPADMVRRARQKQKKRKRKYPNKDL